MRSGPTYPITECAWRPALVSRAGQFNQSSPPNLTHAPYRSRNGPAPHRIFPRHFSDGLETVQSAPETALTLRPATLRLADCHAAWPRASLALDRDYPAPPSPGLALTSDRRPCARRPS